MLLLSQVSVTQHTSMLWSDKHKWNASSLLHRLRALITAQMPEQSLLLVTEVSWIAMPPGSSSWSRYELRCTRRHRHIGWLRRCANCRALARSAAARTRFAGRTYEAGAGHHGDIALLADRILFSIDTEAQLLGNFVPSSPAMSPNNRNRSTRIPAAVNTESKRSLLLAISRTTYITAPNCVTWMH